MAWLKQRGNIWYAVWLEHGVKQVKTTKIPVKGNKERKFAQATAAAMEAASKGTLMLSSALDAVRMAAEAAGLGKSVPTIEEYFTGFEPSDNEHYCRNFKRSITIFLDSIGYERFNRLNTLRTDTCRSFVQQQLKRVSYETVKAYCRHIKTALNAAVRSGLLERSPFAPVQLSKLAHPRTIRSTKRKPFTPQELHRLINELPPPWNEMVLTSFLTGGQRLGDVACLRWDSVDFDNNCISFRTMKTGREITAPLLPELKTVLLARFTPGEEYVYPTMARRYNQSLGVLSKEFTLLLKTLGIINPDPESLSGDRHQMAEKSFHSIRHTVVSLLRSSNFVSADLAREIVGHASEAVERAYFTPSDDDKKAGLAYLSERVQKAGAQEARLPDPALI